MSIVNAHSLTMEFSDRLLFADASFEIGEREKVGLIGRNGTGKTTLFKLIAGSLEPTDGNIFISSNAKTGYVEQHACSDFTKTAEEEMLGVFSDLIRQEREIEEISVMLEHSHSGDAQLIEKQSALTEKFRAEGGLTFRSRVKSMLSGLGFTKEEQNLKVGDLSGGQRTKISLGKLLLSDSSFILLDEPTNHLDIKSVEWLEDFLAKYTGAAMIISHDRYFLDKTTNKTMEIEYKKITVRKGNYSVFASLKAEQEKAERKKYEQQKKEIERIEGIISQQKTFSQERNYITIASKQKQIDRIKAEMTAPESAEKTVKLKFEAEIPSGNDVIIAENISKAYGEKKLFSAPSLNVYKGERVFLIGENGCGKSTLLKTLIGKIQPDSGFCRFGANVRIGYFDQIQSGLNSEKTVLDEVYDKFPSQTVSSVRGSLGAFGFKGDDISKKMQELSGGERARVALLELMMKKPNLLLLDEPTNHLDISSRESLESALTDYDGTVFCISHDRFLINRLATRILVMRNGEIKSFDGNYDDYIASLPNGEAKAKAKKKPNEYKMRKERESLERKRLTKIKRLEEEIAKAEDEKEALQKILDLPETSSDYEKLLETTTRLDEINKRQEELYGEWLELNENE